MRVEQLRCLVDIAQTGSLTSTAKRLFVSQQAVSKSIAQLEEELGVTILIRSKAGVNFTEEGLSVLDFARKVLTEQDTLLQKFQIVLCKKELTLVRLLAKLLEQLVQMAADVLILHKAV